MAERTSNEYDILQSTPRSLQELSVIAVGLELWRSELNEHRKSQTLVRFRAADNIASLRAKLPKLPSVINDVIVKYATILGNSIADWLDEHSTAVSDFGSRYQSVLECFDDFVVDYKDATIDFVKTAERLMHHDSFDDVLKFMVACRNCLEDHVRRMWPSVREKIDLRSIDFYRNPLLYYWICYLNNQLNMISTGRYDDPVDEKMLRECICTSPNTLAVNYFWNRVPYEKQMHIVSGSRFPLINIECFVRCILPKLLDDERLERYVQGRIDHLMNALLEYHLRDRRHSFQLAMYYFWNFVPKCMQLQTAIYVFQRNRECFAESILPKLNDRELKKFVNQNGSELMGHLLKYCSHDGRLVFQTWMCIKNTMNGSTFSDLVVNMLRTEAGYFSNIDHQKLENWSHQLCYEIWNSAPHNLKRSAITKISTDLKLIICQEGFMSSSRRRTSSEFLLSILSAFTWEEKQSFWHNCWKNLMLNKNARDLQRIMEVCFEHEDDIIQFKENVMAESENLQLRCLSLLSRVNVNELDALINFCYPRSAETAKHLKWSTLQSSLISCDDFYLDFKLVVDCEEFNTFINNAYDSFDLANDFKHQLVSSPNNLEAMSELVLKGEEYAVAVRKFIETFVSTEQILKQTKSFIIDHLKEAAIRRRAAFESVKSEPSFEQFLLWCLGSNEQVLEFRISYIVYRCLENEF